MALVSNRPPVGIVGRWKEGIVSITWVSVSLVIPCASPYRQVSPADRASALAALQRKLFLWFGDCTSMVADNARLDSNGQLVLEPVTIVVTHTGPDVLACRRLDLDNLVLWLRDVLAQDYITVIVAPVTEVAVL